MNDLLNYLQIWGIWEHVPLQAMEAMAEWIAKNQIHSVHQVKVNKDSARVEARSQILENMRLKCCVDLPSAWPSPNWFRISISEAEFRGPRIAVVGNQGQLFSGSFVVQDRNGERKTVHPFRDGNVVRCWRVKDGSRVDVHRMKVEDRGDDGFYLVVSPVYNTFINHFSGPADLEQFFQSNKTPENLQDILAAMVGFSKRNGKIFDPQWDGVLAGLSKTDQGDKAAVKKPEEESKDSRPAAEVDDDKRRSEKKGQRHSREGGRSAKKPRPSAPKDGVRVKRGASLADARQEEAEAD